LHHQRASLHGSKVDHSSVVVQELATVSCDLSSDATGVFDTPLAKVVQNATKTVVPLLLLFLGLPWIGSTKLN
jgi:uncharacterized membrane protein